MIEQSHKICYKGLCKKDYLYTKVWKTKWQSVKKLPQAKLLREKRKPTSIDFSLLKYEPVTSKKLLM